MDNEELMLTITYRAKSGGEIRARNEPHPTAAVIKVNGRLAAKCPYTALTEHLPCGNQAWLGVVAPVLLRFPR